MLEIIGGITIENGKFALLRNLLEINQLKKYGDGIENILDWNVQATYIEIKNETEGKQRGTKWIVPRFHYLLDLVEKKDFPIKFDLRTRITETDLLYFVYSVSRTEDRAYHFWFPCSPVYASHGAPPLFKKIRHDEKFGGIIAKQLFNADYKTLLNLLKNANEVIHTRLRSAYFDSFGGEDVLNDFADK